MTVQLTILFPVRNRQAELARQAREILDAAHLVAASAELIVIDDASTDATEEVARELAATYPQVRYARHAQPRGISAAMETGLQHARGKRVCWLSDASAAELQKLRSRYPQEGMQPLRPPWRPPNVPQPKPLSTNVLDELAAWGQSLASDENLAPRGAAAKPQAAIETHAQPFYRLDATAEQPMEQLKQSRDARRGIYPTLGQKFLQTIYGFATGE